MNKTILTIAVPLAVLASLGACTPTTNSSSFATGETGQVMPVQFGTIQSLRVVQIQPGQTRLGTVTGAVLGGIGGSQIGSNTAANLAGATAGAVAGGAVGSAAQGSSRNRGIEFVIQMDSGDTIAIVQPGDPRDYRIGDRVRVTGTADNARVSR